MKEFDLIVVSVEPFPYGYAATNRMLSYLTGLAKKKNILYLCLAGSSSTKSSNKDKTGCYRGIHFRYITKPTTKKPQSVICRASSLLWRYCWAFFLLIIFYNYKSILVYSSQKTLLKIIHTVSIIKARPLYRDITELVGYNYSKSPSDIEQMKKDISHYDGLITISRGIYNYFDNIPDKRKFLLPVLVDISRFKGHKDNMRYFFCCSGANLERDGLLDSLNGFLQFNKANKGYTLKIATSLNLNDPYHIKCKKIIDSNSDVIHYLGELPPYKIPDIMEQATALMLTPHSNYQTMGFPTKLGEYLASGTPTICSSTEDLLSVISSETTYIVPPNSPDMIAQALCSIVNNPTEANRIGSNGKQLMLDKYTINVYLKKLIVFLHI